MTKKSNYRLGRDKDKQKIIPYHTHIARVQPEKNNAYAYCKICGRAMSQVKVKELVKAMETSNLNHG